MNFESFLESCDKHSNALFGVAVCIMLVIGAIFVGIVQVIKAIKNNNTDIEIEYDTDN